MDYDAPGHQSTQLDIKNPYGQHDAGCMDYYAPGASRSIWSDI